MERSEKAGNSYIAILRGINVSARNMIKMSALTQSFENMGFEQVKTYIQSGNVIFTSKSDDLNQLARHIEEQIRKDFNAQVPVIILENHFLMEVQEKNPFLTRKNIDLTKLHITFLSEEPQLDNVAKIDAVRYVPDEFIIAGKVIYLYCPGGYGTTKLNNGFFEHKLKVTATTRNWNTVNKLVELIRD